MHTITDPVGLADELQASARRGYALESEELALGRGCIYRATLAQARSAAAP